MNDLKLVEKHLKDARQIAIHNRKLAEQATKKEDRRAGESVQVVKYKGQEHGYDHALMIVRGQMAGAAGVKPLPGQKNLFQAPKQQALYSQAETDNPSQERLF